MNLTQFASKFLTRCFVFYFVAILIEVMSVDLVALFSSDGQWFVAPYIPFVIKGLKFVAAFGLGSIFVEMVIHETLVPVFRKMISDLGSGVQTEATKIRVPILRYLEEKGLTINTHFTAHQRQSELVRLELGDYLERGMEDDPRLREAEKAALSEHPDVAIEKLTQLIEDDPRNEEYKIKLATVLAFSSSKRHWDQAEILLGKIDKPRLYLPLAYHQWLCGDLDRAIYFAEKGWSLLSKSKNQKDVQSADSFKNAMAYYYADAERGDKADVARRYAAEAVEESTPTGDPSMAPERDRVRYAEALDTLGYVKISFGDSRKEIEEGITLCEDARRLGTTMDLYVKHVTRATKKIERLSL